METNHLVSDNHPSWCVRQEAAGGDHASNPIPVSHPGDTLGIRVYLWQPQTAETAYVQLELTYDSEIVNCPILLDQARTLSRAMRFLLLRA